MLPASLPDGEKAAKLDAAKDDIRTAVDHLSNAVVKLLEIGWYHKASAVAAAIADLPYLYAVTRDEELGDG